MTLKEAIEQFLHVWDCSESLEGVDACQICVKIIAQDSSEDGMTTITVRNLREAFERWTPSSAWHAPDGHNAGRGE